MSSQGEVIETTVGNVAEELVRRGLDPHDRVTITIEPDELIPGRRETRARVIAAGLTDIDRLIKQAHRRSSRALNEGSSRYQRFGRRSAQIKIYAWQRSTPGMVVLLVERRQVLLKSPATEEQLFGVVARPYFDLLINAGTRAWLTKLMADAEPVTIAERIVACRDPTDDKILGIGDKRACRPDRLRRRRSARTQPIPAHPHRPARRFCGGAIVRCFFSKDEINHCSCSLGG
jgi:hypothetical protein